MLYMQNDPAVICCRVLTNVKNSKDHIGKEAHQLLIKKFWSWLVTRDTSHRSQLIHIDGFDVVIIKFSEYPSVGYSRFDIVVLDVTHHHYYTQRKLTFRGKIF